MSEEEVKGGQQRTKVRPKVHTMKACIVSMSYKIQKNETIYNLKQLNESHDDAEKVKQLF